MATRSMFAIGTDNQSVHVRYVHCDGYALYETLSQIDRDTLLEMTRLNHDFSYIDFLDSERIQRMKNSWLTPYVKQDIKNGTGDVLCYYCYRESLIFDQPFKSFQSAMEAVEKNPADIEWFVTVYINSDGTIKFSNFKFDETQNEIFIGVESKIV